MREREKEEKVEEIFKKSDKKMATSDGGSSSANLGIRTNVSVTNINCTNTLSSMPSTVLTSDATASISSPITSSTNANSIDVINGANGFSENNLSNNPITMDSHTANNNNQSHFYGNGSIRIAVPKMEESDESDTELSQIENTAAVSMRGSVNKDTPRPMSWEGELSENEDRMDTDNSKSAIINEMINNSTNGNNEETKMAQNPVSLVATTVATAATTTATSQNNGKQITNKFITKDEIKPEYSDFIPTSGTNTSHLSNALYGNKPPYPLDMSNLKFEANFQAQQITNQYAQQQQHQQQQSNQGDINSPLLIRSKTNNLLPTNPSPDSAIHSVYTHSSPSQSPLTSRHTPYTPSLSRNNSDASYSSCYSYSSEFSPTHSPIQGRHNMYNAGAGGNFNGSPLHHSVLYKPMIDGNENAKQQLQHQQSNEEQPLEPEIIPSAGISRQQLINR